MFDVIGADFFGEGITSKMVSRTLAENSDAETILVRINSPGGDVFEGNAIFSLLKTHSATIEVEVIGMAASMASVIAQVGDTVRIAPNAMMMIHDPWTIAFGNASKFRKTAETLDKVKSTLLGIYTSKSGKTEAEVSKMMISETWMTAEEAVEHGFADEVMEYDEDDAKDEAPERFFAALQQFRHTPSHLLSGETRIAATATQPNKREDKPMKWAKLLAALGLPEDATEEQAITALSARPPASVESFDLDTMVPRADYDALRARLDAMEKTQAEERARLFAEKVETVVNQAIKDGKIAPASKDYHIGACVDEAALQRFEDYTKSAPVMVSNSQMERAERQHGGEAPASALDAQARQLLERMGISPEDFKATQEEMRNKPQVYNPDMYRYAL